MGNTTSKFRKAIQQGNEILACQLYVQNPDIRERLDPNDSHGNVDGNTPLHFVAKFCMKSLLRDFISRGGNPNTLNKDGQNALHMLMMSSDDNVLPSTAQRRLDCLHLLLKWRRKTLINDTEGKIDIFAIDKDKRTALHYAASAGLLLCVQCLTDEDSTLFLEDKQSFTACDLAEQNNHFAVAAFLEAKMLFSFQKEDIIAAPDNPVLNYIDEEYASLCPVDLQESKDQLIIDTSDMLQVPLFTAEALLHNHRWSKEKLLEAWMHSDPFTICEKAGVQLPHDHCAVKIKNNQRDECTASLPRNSCILQSKGSCDICEENFSINKQITEMPCGHLFCDECWNLYLSTKISHGKTHNILCPGHDCEKLVPVELTEKLVSRDMAKIYLEFDIKAFVDTNPNLVWCPHPNCEIAIKIPETASSSLNNESQRTRAKSVDCGKGHYFCSACLGEAHEPCSCEQWHKWKKKIQEIDPQKENGLSNERSAVATAYWLITNSKKCPNCASHIQKNEGCNHMTCSKCKHEFCWVCMEPWKIHSAETGGYFRCNRYEAVKKVEEEHEKEQQEIELDHDKVQKINRFMHYYTRYKNHENSFQLEARLLKAVEEKIHCLQKTAYELAFQDEKKEKFNVDFLEDAVKELLKSRQILKGSYPYGYFLDNATGEIVVFEFMQDEVEQSTESLSHMIARRFLKSTRVQIINATRKLSRKRKEFVTAISRGLIPDDNDDDDDHEFDYSRLLYTNTRHARINDQSSYASGSDLLFMSNAGSNHSIRGMPSDLTSRDSYSENTLTTPSRESPVNIGAMNNDVLVENHSSRVIAQFDYVAYSAEELSIEAGDVINVIGRRSDGWWKGSCRGCQGFFPATFVIDIESPSLDTIVDDHVDVSMQPHQIEETRFDEESNN